MALTIEQTPNYAMMTHENFFVVMWHHHTTLEGVEKFSQHLETHSKLHPKGLGLVTIIPTAATPPPTEVRGALAKALTAAKFVKGSAVCFEGTGLRATIVRSVVTGMTLLSAPPYPHKVFASIPEGVTFVNQQLTIAGAPTSRMVNDVETWRQSVI